MGTCNCGTEPHHGQHANNQDSTHRDTDLTITSFSQLYFIVLNPPNAHQLNAIFQRFVESIGEFRSLKGDRLPFRGLCALASFFIDAAAAAAVAGAAAAAAAAANRAPCVSVHVDMRICSALGRSILNILRCPEDGNVAL